MLDILIIVALISLLIASLSDLKTREVPDWLSFSTIFLGFGIRALYSLTTRSWDSIVAGSLGFLAFFIVGHLMYRTGQWGGGDSKLLMGIGVLIGLKPDFTIVPLILVFWLNTLFAGATYGMVYSMILAFKHRKKFIKEYVKKRKRYAKHLYISLAFSILLLIISFFSVRIMKFTLMILSLITILTMYLWIFVRSIEKAIMIKKIPIEKLTEGDWIVKDVMVDNKRICGPKDLGIEKKQIAQLIKLKQKGKIQNIVIKEGIPFVPSFLIAYIATLLLGNWLLLL